MSDMPKTPAAIASVRESTLPRKFVLHLEDFYKDHNAHALDAIAMVSVCMQHTKLANATKDYSLEAKSFTALAHHLESWTKTLTVFHVSIHYSHMFMGEYAQYAPSNMEQSIQTIRTYVIGLANYTRSMADASDACIGSRFLFFRRAPKANAAQSRQAILDKLPGVLKESKRLLTVAQDYRVSNLPAGMDFCKHPLELLKHLNSFL